MYDLLLKGGNVIDPSQDLRGGLDIAVENGKIAKVAANIPAAEARRVVDVPGKTVTPGLIGLLPWIGTAVLVLVAAFAAGATLLSRFGRTAAMAV